MANEEKIRGVETQHIVEPNDDWRDVRSGWTKMTQGLEKRQSMMILALVLIGVMFIFPVLAEIVFIMGMYIFYKLSKRKFSLPFRMPQSSGMMDPNSIKPGGKGEIDKASGIAFLGNERGTNKELWLTNSDMRTHLLVFGSTGAGKALRNDELIHTPHGWIKNKDLSLGDFVTMPNGEATEIVGIYPQGKKELYNLVFDDGRNIKVSGDHLWEVFSINEKVGDRVGEVISTIEFQKRLSRGQKLGVRTVRNINQKEKSIDFNIDVLAHKIAMFDSKYEEIVNRIKMLNDGSLIQRETLWKEFNKSIKENNSYYAKHNEYKIYAFKNNVIAEAMKNIAYSLGMWAKIEDVKDHSVRKHEWNNEVTHVLIVKDTDILKVENILLTEETEECQCIKVANRSGLFVTKDYLVTHNTETLISLAFNTLVHGSGFIYVDGKGDNSLFAKIFSIVRSVGRENDLLVLNYMTGGRDVFGPQKTKLSNTLNPLISGSAGGLTELIVGLMDDAGGDGGMWKGRAISLMSGVMRALVWLRDNDGLLLDVDQLRKYLILENIQKLSKRPDLPTGIVAGLKSYLVSLPGYQDGAAKQQDIVGEQHGYLQMQFTRVLGSLSDDYGYIFRTNLGEIDFFDVVINRRILVVLLPALEKSIDELGNLGKIVVACIKSMMATGLGDQLEGEYKDVIETKPTNAPAPYMCILDEYGYYVVKGAAVMPAQARSLGFSMVFAGQDYPAFQKNNNKEEAISTIGNCNIKIFMKVEDPDDTYNLFKSSVGEALVKKTSGLTKSTGALGNTFQDSGNINITKISRGDLLDLKDQKEGEAHIIFRSVLIRARMFYAAPDNVERLQLNHFLRVEPPEKDIIQCYEESVKKMTQQFMKPNFMADYQSQVEESANINFIVDLMNTMKKENMSDRDINAGIVAAVHMVNYAGLDEFRGSMIADMESQKNEEDNDHISLFSDHLNDNDDDEVDFNIGNDEDDLTAFYNKDTMRENFAEIEKVSGASSEIAKQKSNKMIDDLQNATRYPKYEAEVPKEIFPMEVMTTIGEMLEDLE